MRRMPPDWTPPSEAWQSDYDPAIRELLFGYFGMQQAAAVPDAAFERWIETAIAGPHAPAFATRARETDASGYRNDVLIAYWPGQAAFDAWWARAEVGGWWNDAAREQGDCGYWRECFAVPVERFETLFSSKDPTGAASLGKPFGCPVREHAYWGGMRDRIAASSWHALDGDGTTLLAAADLKATRGRRVRVRPPEDLCLIRSGQNWGASSGDELATYVDVVRPSLTAGMAFLRDNPAETGCLSCRFMDEVALDGSAQPRSFGLAWFLTLGHLEAWAHSHPTHLAIFKSFFDMLEARQGQLALKLWHEVLVLDAGRGVFEYVNCHPRTGLLPWLPGV